ncbi:MAG: glycerol-3-phosphate acyltransferase [Bacteroidota bacterium]|nr:glycerol-3-phosphate acyltransferase [Bacteroidota bacterium]
MYFLFLFLSMALGYLSGSISFAILISRWVKGIDIRTFGNMNPGTANVGREVGIGWGALVLLGDLAKGLLPLLIARLFFFPDDNHTDYFALFLTGMSVITGHCWPLYFRFRGGRGLATSIAIYMFFIPVEFFLTLVIALIVVQVFFRKKKYSLGMLTPMVFVPLAPILLILSNLLFDTRLFNTLKVGGYPWYVLVGVITMSAYIFFINRRVVVARITRDEAI